jgi:hypothetical protein
MADMAAFPSGHPRSGRHRARSRRDQSWPDARVSAQAEVAMTMIARELAVPVRIIVREAY